MSKELKALNKVAYCYGYDKNIEIIEAALKKLESIEDTRFIILGGRNSGKTQKINTLLKLKALEIIKEYIGVNCLIEILLGSDCPKEKINLLKEVLK